MIQMPKGKTLIIFIAVIIGITFATIASIVFLCTRSKTVQIDRYSFENYFNVDITCSEFNDLYQVNYEVTPKKNSIAKKEQSSERINVVFAVSFYEGYNGGGTYLDVEYVRITLLKSKGYKASGIKSIEPPLKAKSYVIKLSSASGVVCA